MNSRHMESFSLDIMEQNPLGYEVKYLVFKFQCFGYLKIWKMYSTKMGKMTSLPYGRKSFSFRDISLLYIFNIQNITRTYHTIYYTLHILIYHTLQIHKANIFLHTEEIFSSIPARFLLQNSK